MTQAGPPGLMSGAQGRLVRETMALGYSLTSHLPCSRFCFPFKPWHGFSMVEVLGGELARWDPSTDRSLPHPALLLESGPAGAGSG